MIRALDVHQIEKIELPIINSIGLESQLEELFFDLRALYKTSNFEQGPLVGTGTHSGKVPPTTSPEVFKPEQTQAEKMPTSGHQLGEIPIGKGST